MSESVNTPKIIFKAHRVAELGVNVRSCSEAGSTTRGYSRGSRKLLTSSIAFPIPVQLDSFGETRDWRSCGHFDELGSRGDEPERVQELLAYFCSCSVALKTSRTGLKRVDEVQEPRARAASRLASATARRLLLASHLDNGPTNSIPRWSLLPRGHHQHRHSSSRTRVSASSVGSAARSFTDACFLPTESSRSRRRMDCCISSTRISKPTLSLRTSSSSPATLRSSR